jgi:hypothetical protein
MKRGRASVVAGAALVGLFAWQAAEAGEHGGHEHGGAATQEHGGAATQEHGGQAVTQAEPSPELIRQAIRDHISQFEQEEGGFQIEDPVEGATRTLKLIQVHERVGKTGNLYYSCTDMKDTASGQTLDLDFDVSNESGQLEVVDTRIHKVDGNARYTYDDKNNRIPVTE